MASDTHLMQHSGRKGGRKGGHSVSLVRRSILLVPMILVAGGAAEVVTAQSQSYGLRFEGHVNAAGHQHTRYQAVFACLLLVGGILILAWRRAKFLNRATKSNEAAGGNSASDKRLGHYAVVLFAIIAFLLVGPGLVVLNKYIFQDVGFKYPLSVSGLGVVASAIFSRAGAALGFFSMRPESLEAVSGRNWFRFSLPVGACKAMTLASGNAAYLHLGLGFIQMLKAFTPAIILVVMILLTSSKPSRSAVWFVLLIVAGTVFEVHGEIDASALGLGLMILSEVVEAVNVVLTQILLQEKKFTVMEGMYALQPPSATCLMLAAAVLEWPTIIRNGHLHMVFDKPHFFLAGAALGLAVNFVSFFLVQATSSLFCKILNTVRSICLVFFGVIVYGEECSVLEMFGYSVALLGFAGYNYVAIFPQEGERLERACGCCCCSRAAQEQKLAVNP